MGGKVSKVNKAHPKGKRPLHNDDHNDESADDGYDCEVEQSSSFPSPVTQPNLEPVLLQDAEVVAEPIEVRSEECHETTRFSPPKRVGITFNTGQHRNSQRDERNSTQMTGAETLEGDECKLTERPFHLEKVARVPTKAYLKSGDAKKMLLMKDGKNSSDEDEDEYSD